MTETWLLSRLTRENKGLSRAQSFGHQQSDTLPSCHVNLKGVLQGHGLVARVNNQVNSSWTQEILTVQTLFESGEQSRQKTKTELYLTHGVLRKRKG